MCWAHRQALNMSYLVSSVQQPYEVGTVIAPISLMEQLRQEGFPVLASGQIDKKRQRQVQTTFSDGLLCPLALRASLGDAEADGGQAGGEGRARCQCQGATVGRDRALTPPQSTQGSICSSCGPAQAPEK